MCVYVYHNISGTTPSITIKFDMHIYFLDSEFGKNSYFYFLNYIFLWPFFDFRKTLFCVFQSPHCYKQFSYNAFERE
ncbi:hypothetical protein TSAR_012300 [Trichomalopsis sarcophagae]|uniref:Uncharacterized protein n=1 Tax=Trichomalopsis sarcophagae TaxID=543379 RepID=A0A232FN62_9HYME|nr:hypothetical protein TSAR_012300 [Trichomalopsis sarcophagae]